METNNVYVLSFDETDKNGDTKSGALYFTTAQDAYMRGRNLAIRKVASKVAPAYSNVKIEATTCEKLGITIDAVMPDGTILTLPTYVF